MKKYARWIGLDGAEVYFRWGNDQKEYRAFIARLRDEMRTNAAEGVWCDGHRWLLAEARRGLRAAKKGRRYRQKLRPCAR